jgi:hypothetical protein
VLLLGALSAFGAPAALAPMAVVMTGFAVLGLVAALRVPVLPGPEVAPPA